MAHRTQEGWKKAESNWFFGYNGNSGRNQAFSSKKYIYHRRVPERVAIKLDYRYYYLW